MVLIIKTVIGITGGMPGIHLLSDSLEELRLNLEANKTPWRNGLVPCLVMWFMSVFQGKE